MRTATGAFYVLYQETGATTFRKGMPGKLKGKGKEPDTSFYLREAAQNLVGRKSLDLSVDPPPSLWVEVENRGSSRASLPIYAGLRVPEVWRYRVRRRTIWIGRLQEDQYQPVDTSPSLPGLRSADILEILDAAETRVMSVWEQWMEEVWFPGHRQELLDRGAGH